MIKGINSRKPLLRIIFNCLQKINTTNPLPLGTGTMYLIRAASARPVTQIGLSIYNGLLRVQLKKTNGGFSAFEQISTKQTHPALTGRCIFCGYLYLFYIQSLRKSRIICIYMYKNAYKKEPLPAWKNGKPHKKVLFYRIYCVTIKSNGPMLWKR